MKNIFIDCEWNPFNNSKIFLIGYSYNLSSFGYITEENINAKEFLKILKPVDGFVFVYGPDIGFLERNLSIDIRKRFRCVNLLALVRKEIPGLANYKLYKVEQHFGILRKTMSYKYDILRILEDWKNPRKRKKVIKYNEEDVINLVRVFRELRKTGLNYHRVRKYRIN